MRKACLPFVFVSLRSRLAPFRFRPRLRLVEVQLTVIHYI